MQCNTENVSGLKLFTETTNLMVAECSVCCRRCVVKHIGDIRSKNADMSSNKQLKHCSPKVQGFLNH